MKDIIIRKYSYKVLLNQKEAFFKVKVVRMDVYNSTIWVVFKFALKIISKSSWKFSRSVVVISPSMKIIIIRRFISWEKGRIGVSLRTNQWFILSRKLLFTKHLKFCWEVLSRFDHADDTMLVWAPNKLSVCAWRKVKQEHLYNCLICVIWWIKTMIVSVYHKVLFRKSVIHCILIKLLMRKVNRLKHAVYGPPKFLPANLLFRCTGLAYPRPRVPSWRTHIY